MLVAGGGIEGRSAEGVAEDGLLALRDWLKWRISEALRAGRWWEPVPGVNESGPASMASWVAGWRVEAVAAELLEVLNRATPPPPGAGKSLRAGS